MIELHRITSGYLFCGDESNEINFGFIYDSDGYIDVEIYVPANNASILKKYWVDNSIKGVANKLRVEGETVIGEKITVFGLAPNYYSASDPSIAKFRCMDKLIFERPEIDKKVDRNEKAPDKIFFIEFEGLKIEHEHITEKIIHRANSYRKVKGKFNIESPDHTTFVINLLDKFSFFTHYGELYDSPTPNNDNLVLEFKDYLTKETFDLNKKYLLNFFSFINGGEVRIRKIYTGSYFSSSEKKLDSQIIETYSYRKMDTEFVSKYIPISSKWYRSSETLKQAIKCYQKFIKEHDTLDFNSTIFYLNKANANDNPEQKIFTLLVALEELGSKQRQLNNDRKKTIIPNTDFDPIKEALKETLTSFKASIPNTNNQYNDLLSKLCDINTKKADTNEKFFELFEHSRIERTPEIEQLVTKRHFAIHEGEIGNSLKNKWLFYLRLDHLIRDIILNRIGYDGERNIDHALQ